ncbi:MAG: sensor histidine kinase [Candidatus Dadabacteria bacterium]
MRRKYLLILLLLLFIFLQCIGQHEYTITNINSENGLPQNTVKDLHFDNAGFLWIATENGLLRYDGYVFKTFSSHDVEPINNRIIRLNCNPGNQLFAIDINGTIAEISNGKITVVRKGSFNHPLSPIISLGNQLPASLFMRMDQDSNLFEQENSILENFIAINDDEYYVVYDKAISLYKKTERKDVFSFPTANRHEVFSINGQLFVLDYSGGFYVFELIKKQWRKVTNGTGFNKLGALDIIWEHHYNLPFVAYNDRLYELNFTGDKLVSTLLIDSLAVHSNITSVEVDSITRQYFIGTQNEGLFIYRKKVFKTLLSDHQKKAYYGQLALNDNYILTNRGDIVGQGPGRPVSGPIERFSNYLISDKRNNLYYASGDTVFKYTAYDRKSRVLFVDRKSEMIVLNFYKDTLWMINSNGIYYHVNGNNFTSKVFTLNQNNIPYVVDRLNPGILLFGNCMGLFTYQPSTRKIDTILFYPQRCVRSIWRYNDKIFIGTYGEGWKVWTGNKIFNMPLDVKGYLLYSHCFIKDESNYLWIPTNHGLFKYYLPDIENFISRKSSTLFSFYYSNNDGLENSEFNGGCYPCYVKLNNGYYSLPNLSGLVWFKPAEVELPQNSNQIYINRIEVNNELREIKDELLSLPGSTRILRIEVSSPFFGDQNNYPIEYRTFGVDTTWKLLNRFTSAVRYTTLPAGNYHLQIRKPLGFGRPYLMTSFHFTIKPAWHASPVAIAFWILLLILLLMLIMRARVHRYKEKGFALQKMVDQQVREIKEANIKLEQNVEILQKYQQELIKRDLTQSRFIRIISHDIIGPLRFLMMTTTQIEKHQDTIDKQFLLESLGDIKNTGENLLSLSVDILNWINYQKENINIVYERFNLHQVLQEKVQLFDGMAKRKSVQLSYECANPFFIQNDLNVIKIIVRNLLTNAIKFTRKGKVFISSGIKDESYYLAVKDTGIGMSEAQVKNLLGSEFVQSTSDTENTKGYGIGFMIIRELVAGTKGTMQIESIKGQGTTITIKWPLQSDLVEHQQPMFETSINTTIGGFEQSS